MDAAAEVADQKGKSVLVDPHAGDGLAPLRDDADEEEVIGQAGIATEGGEALWHLGAGFGEGTTEVGDAALAADVGEFRANGTTVAVDGVAQRAAALFGIEFGAAQRVAGHGLGRPTAEGPHIGGDLPDR